MIIPVEESHILSQADKRSKVSRTGGKYEG